MRKVFIYIFLSLQLVVFAQDIPSSSRSREAIERVKPNLQIEFDKSGFSPGLPIFLRIFKEEKELEIWVESQNGYHLFKKYPICTYGYGSLGPKTKQGDGQAPEG